MKLLTLIAFLLPVTLFSQEVADSEYYLVDSLVLEDLTDRDQLILDSCLNVYELAKDDTAKILINDCSFFG